VYALLLLATALVFRARRSTTFTTRWARSRRAWRWRACTRPSAAWRVCGPQYRVPVAAVLVGCRCSLQRSLTCARGAAFAAQFATIGCAHVAPGADHDHPGALLLRHGSPGDPAAGGRGPGDGADVARRGAHYLVITSRPGVTRARSGGAAGFVPLGAADGMPVYALDPEAVP
jgi:hypothetical protein